MLRQGNSVRVIEDEQAATIDPEYRQPCERAHGGGAWPRPRHPPGPTLDGIAGMRILVVEDDPNLAKVLCLLLRKEGHVVDLANSLRMAKTAITDNPYDIILLDRRLPDGEGTELISSAREQGVRTRYLVLSGLSDPNHRVEGLDLGADDYLAKPFEPTELCARIRALGRRPLGALPRMTRFGRLGLNWDNGEVSALRRDGCEGTPIAIPRRELALLRRLMERPGGVVTREALDASMYGYDDLIQSNTLESHVSRLRKRLARHNTAVAIHVVRGVGYRLQEVRATEPR